MLPNLLRQSSMCAALTLLLFSCRQPINLDTDRTVVPTNVPEITEFLPKAGYLGDTITIIGKNFVNVESVMLDELPVPTFNVISSTHIVVILPTLASILNLPPSVVRQGFRTFIVKTKIATASVPKGFVMARGMVGGKIMIENEPLDSADIFLTIPSRKFSGQTDLRLAGPQVTMFNPQRGWYFVDNGNFLLQASQLQAPEDVTIRPMRTGYGFKPIERTVRTQYSRQMVIAPDFEAVITPLDQMPEVTSIMPNFGRSFSNTSLPETGTDIVFYGKGFSGVRKILIGVTYSMGTITNIGTQFGVFGTTVLIEAGSFQIFNDSQMTMRLPRLPSQIAIPGGQYLNCKIFLLRDDTSLLAPQRISIQYN